MTVLKLPARYDRKSGTRLKKKPLFPLGCVIICYETMSTTGIAALIRWSEEGVRSYLHRAGVKMRSRGGGHNKGKKISRRI